ncbi:MAG: NAD-dependent epimerase/dehydratase family protein, partial [Eubacterium sp.]|nr:NAD-dependent epimerase/dehydratase family protein [Eubacterium sp.]
MTKKILVAGGAGYIGSHVQKQLLEEGFEVLVFDDLSSGEEVNILPEAEFIRGNILDKQVLDMAMAQGIDGVVHLAAKKAVGESMVKPEIYAENNLTGSINILNAMVANEVKHIVFSSSAAVYGMPQYVPIDEKHPYQGQSPYSATKIGADRLAESFYRSFQMPISIVRPFNTYGPRQSARAVIPTIITQ